MNIEETVQILIDHRGGEFRTRRDGEMEAGWYCVCGQIYTRAMPYDPKHLAIHQATMLKKLELQNEGAL